MLVFMVLFFISALLDALHALFHLILKEFVREQNTAPILQKEKLNIFQPWVLAVRLCWSETFSEALTNHPTQFSGKSPDFRVSKMGCNWMLVAEMWVILIS